jgi:hypothetical protein
MVKFPIVFVVGLCVLLHGSTVSGGKLATLRNKAQNS